MYQWLGIILFTLLSSQKITGQTGPIRTPSADSAQVAASPTLTFGAYADIYYLYDFNRPVDHERPAFVYQYSRHNEIALNNTVLSAAYTANRVRGNVALHTGTYVQRNYAAEELNGSEVLKFIYQANIGVRIGKGVWLDAGILPSHIGVESALSLDNPTLTRSLMADNTPYYETGAKLTWEVSKKVTLTGLVLNGWQRIVETDQNKAIGTQIQFKPTEGILLNSSTFIGKEITNRYFHNLYAVFDLIDNLTITAAFDVGWQEQLKNNGDHNGYRAWWNPNLIIRYRPVDKWAIALRTEYYHDPHNVIIPATQLDNVIVSGFQTFSPSLNVDYYPAKNVALRLEGRFYQSQNKVFIKDKHLVGSNGIVVSSLAFKF